MKKIKEIMYNILPHITIVLSLMFMIFLFLDILNPNMNFVNCSISNKLLFIFCIVSFLTSILEIILVRKYK